MQWIEAQAQMHHVTGLTSNKVLQTLAKDVVDQTKRAYTNCPVAPVLRRSLSLLACVRLT